MPEQPAVTSSDWLKKYEEERLKRVAELPEKAEKLRQKLLATGVTKVTAKYSGCEDSGQIDDIGFEPENIPLNDEVENFFYDALGARHPGWEINEGASGDIVWDLVGDKLEWTHHSYYTESDTSTYEKF